MYDLHLHSYYSDGDLSVEKIVNKAKENGLLGISLTDHNGVWGIDEAARIATDLDLSFVEGIEVSSKFKDMDVHVLGYSKSFDREVLDSGLSATRDGYRERLGKMVQLCHENGYDKVSFEAIEERRSFINNPSYISYDLGIELLDKYGLSRKESLPLTTIGGKCHVPYGEWALSPREAIELVQKAEGLAILAHPGLIKQSVNDEIFIELIDTLIEAGLNGVEVYHPYHDADMVSYLSDLAMKNRLLVTGGSDWHGPGRYEKSDDRLGFIGTSKEDFEKLISSF